MQTCYCKHYSLQWLIDKVVIIFQIFNLVIKELSSCNNCFLVTGKVYLKSNWCYQKGFDRHNWSLNYEFYIYLSDYTRDFSIKVGVK